MRPKPKEHTHVTSTAAGLLAFTDTVGQRWYNRINLHYASAQSGAVNITRTIGAVTEIVKTATLATDTAVGFAFDPPLHVPVGGTLTVDASDASTSTQASVFASYARGRA